VRRGPFAFKQHGQCGRWVSAVFPHLAGCVDDMAFLIAMVSKSNVHRPGSYMMNTGFLEPGFSCMGAWTGHRPRKTHLPPQRNRAGPDRCAWACDPGDLPGPCCLRAAPGWPAFACTPRRRSLSEGPRSHPRFSSSITSSFRIFDRKIGDRNIGERNRRP
jgi:hypothetical protein